MDVFYHLQNYNNQSVLLLDQLKYNKSKITILFLKTLLLFYLK